MRYVSVQESEVVTENCTKELQEEEWLTRSTPNNASFSFVLREFTNVHPGLLCWGERGIRELRRDGGIMHTPNHVCFFSCDILVVVVWGNLQRERKTVERWRREDASTQSCLILFCCILVVVIRGIFWRVVGWDKNHGHIATLALFLSRSLSHTHARTHIQLTDGLTLNSSFVEQESVGRIFIIGTTLAPMVPVSDPSSSYQIVSCSHLYFSCEGTGGGAGWGFVWWDLTWAKGNGWESQFVMV